MIIKQVQVAINEEIFEELQGMAEPLIDDVNSVVSRLLNHWKLNPPPKPGGGGEGVWTSARGERLPIGMKLRALYLGNRIEAVVGAEGIVYQGRPHPSPSRAAIAAKRAHGAKGNAANANGWDFWEYYDEKAKEWRLLRVYR